MPQHWQYFNAGWHACHSWPDIRKRTLTAMFAIMLLGLFLVLAIVSMLGLTADSRDFHPRLPVQAPNNRRDLPSAEPIEHTALPPSRQFRTQRAPRVSA